jgi:hypothetical protein
LKNKRRGRREGRGTIVAKLQDNLRNAPAQVRAFTAYIFLKEKQIKRGRGGEDEKEREEREGRERVLLMYLPFSVLC